MLKVLPTENKEIIAIGIQTIALFLHYRVPSVLPMLEPDQVMKLSMDSILTNQRYVYAPGWFFRSVQIMKT